MAKHTPTPEAFEGESEPVAGNSAAGKGRATPSRAEQEAARRRPLVANTKEAKAAARAELAAKRDRARVGMAAGEEKYLPVRDRGPQKRWVRDYIDSQWHLGEFVIPLMIVVIVITFINIPMLQLYAMIGLWGFIILVMIDMAFTSWRTKRTAREKFGASRMEKGLGWYAAMRSLQMRVLRMPKPQVRRGQRPE